MKYTLRSVAPEDKASIIDIFNYYVENSFAAYPEQKVPYEFFGMLIQLAKGYPFYVALAGENVVGYGLLRPPRALRDLPPYRGADLFHCAGAHW